MVRGETDKNSKRHHVQITIDPSDEEYKDIWKHQRQRQCHAIERSLKHAYGKPLYQKTDKAMASEAKSRFDCFIEAHESTRQRKESVTKKIHEEHIAGKGQNSVLHYNSVNKFIPVLQAMKIPDAKEAVDWQWKKVETIPAWDVKKSKARSVISWRRSMAMWQLKATRPNSQSSRKSATTSHDQS